MIHRSKPWSWLFVQRSMHMKLKKQSVTLLVSVKCLLWQMQVTSRWVRTCAIPQCSMGQDEMDPTGPQIPLADVNLVSFSDVAFPLMLYMHAGLPGYGKVCGIILRHRCLSSHLQNKRCAFDFAPSSSTRSKRLFRFFLEYPLARGSNTSTWTKIFSNHPPIHSYQNPLNVFFQSTFLIFYGAQIPFGRSNVYIRKNNVRHNSWVSVGVGEGSVCERRSTSPATLISSKSYQAVENLRQDPWLTI